MVSPRTPDFSRIIQRRLCSSREVNLKRNILIITVILLVGFMTAAAVASDGTGKVFKNFRAWYEFDPVSASVNLAWTGYYLTPQQVFGGILQVDVYGAATKNGKYVKIGTYYHLLKEKYATFKYQELPCFIIDYPIQVMPYRETHLKLRTRVMIKKRWGRFSTHYIGSVLRRN